MSTKEDLDSLILYGNQFQSIFIHSTVKS